MPENFDFDIYAEWLRKEVNSGSDRFNLFSVSYMESHEKRFRKTSELIENLGHFSTALEIGATDFFQVFLKNTIGISELWGTILSEHIYEKLYTKTFNCAEFKAESNLVSIDLESELFPLKEGTFDLILFCEVIEHLDIDPMFCLIEINRIMKKDGYLILSTPNSCSARIAYKACLGFRPHFFMQYEKNRSPYRHNFEYDHRTLMNILKCAGFTIDKIESHDVFEEPHLEAIEFLRRNDMPLDFRGDDLFVVARKTSDPIERWPSDLYV